MATRCHPHEIVKVSYRFHGDLDRFLMSVIPSIGALMVHGGRLLGHYDGLDRSVYEATGDLAESLEIMWIRGWFDVFREDLTRIFERCGEWRSQKFLALNRHIERVLWQFGVFPWRDARGQVRVEIPLATDAAQLMEHVKGKPAPSAS